MTTGNLDVNVHGNVILISKTSQGSINWWTEKQNALSMDKAFLDNKNKWGNDHCFNTDEPWNILINKFRKQSTGLPLGLPRIRGKVEEK